VRDRPGWDPINHVRDGRSDSGVLPRTVLRALREPTERCPGLEKAIVYIAASGYTDDTAEVSFSAVLHPFGVGTTERLQADNVASLRVADDRTHQIWMADATNPVGYSTALEAIPGGASQVDTLTIEDGHAWGTATFIEREAVFDAWSTHGPLPAPVPGSFDIRCPGS